MRKITKDTPDKLNENFCMDSLNLDAELSSIWNQFISEFQEELDTVAPEKKVNLLKRRRTP